ncbi:hypothetical protein D187_005849 [Cystobacter fuscus DSM 2262]|uniref:Uncharacterized protein n=1 Tax=Cystobacter fuscus (strain ATCC 25194 / DSM 2262 / NBRC 100088 / M29) TaxID=1242864 RepID=S9R3G7_CYSF2|nr:hypothetical protein [Cystobacter fuscus]EPX63443.1 hypothetical protein D187_005849 [Cystobacter fuscus DSM 2262]
MVIPGGLAVEENFKESELLTTGEGLTLLANEARLASLAALACGGR